MEPGFSTTFLIRLPPSFGPRGNVDSERLAALDVEVVMTALLSKSDNWLLITKLEIEEPKILGFVICAISGKPTTE